MLCLPCSRLQDVWPVSLRALGTLTPDFPREADRNAYLEGVKEKKGEIQGMTPRLKTPAANDLFFFFFFHASTSGFAQTPSLMMTLRPLLFGGLANCGAGRCWVIPTY